MPVGYCEWCDGDLGLNGLCPRCDIDDDSNDDEDGGWAVNKLHSDSIWDEKDDDQSQPPAPERRT